MDTLTHVLIGASLAHACQPAQHSDQHLKLFHRVTLGALSAAFPDIDYITYLINPLSFISDWHRAETHSFVLLPLWALLLALLFTQITHQKTKFKEVFIICCMSLTSHIFTDLITSWGTQVFAPISNERYALGISFVIDPYFSGIILIGLVTGLFRQRPIATRIALLCLLVYMGFQTILKTQVLNIARQQIVANQWKGSNIYTMPQPFSPLHWKIIITSDEHYYLTYINLMKRTHYPFLPIQLDTIIQHYHPVDALNWQTFNRYDSSSESDSIQQAWNQPVFQAYRTFARYPAYYTRTESAIELCYWFIDLRFTLPELEPSFIYGACQNLSDTSQWTVKLHN